MSHNQENNNSQDQQPNSQHQQSSGCQQQWLALYNNFQYQVAMANATYQAGVVNLLGLQPNIPPASVTPPSIPLIPSTAPLSPASLLTPADDLGPIQATPAPSSAGPNISNTRVSRRIISNGFFDTSESSGVCAT